ncbi:hypothetical protein BJG92_03072 [Arthrobacter sp. SO5]|nr:hypothetical protein [Arthrobacter sp. SO5]
MSVLVASCLGLLTLLRVSALWNPPARPAFMASVFATAGFTLYIEPVYVAVDSIMGGRNLAGLILSLSVLAAFSQLHVAVTSAAGASANIVANARRGTFGRHKVAWILASLILIAGFLMSDLPVTSPSLIRTYGSQPGMMAFLLAASSFIAYTSASIVRVLVSHLRQMSAAFRFGFFLVCAGCLGAISLLAARSVLQFVADRSIQESFSPYYGVGQGVAVICVAAGLSTSRLVGIGHTVSFDIAARWHLLRMLPLWRAATRGKPNLVLHNGRLPVADVFNARPHTALQRRITEIRDCLLVDPDGLSDTWATHGSILIQAERLMKAPLTTSSTDRTAA